MSDSGREQIIRDAIREALEDAEPGQTIMICRDVSRCQPEELCEMCARITVVHGMTVEDVMQAAKVYRA